MEHPPYKVSFDDACLTHKSVFKRKVAEQLSLELTSARTILGAQAVVNGNMGKSELIDETTIGMSYWSRVVTQFSSWLGGLRLSMISEPL
jgi:hypothetical protein